MNALLSSTADYADKTDRTAELLDEKNIREIRGSSALTVKSANKSTFSLTRTCSNKPSKTDSYK
jgi:hypothetical protein